MSTEPGSVLREVISDSPDLGYPCALLKENKRDKNTSHTKMASIKHENVIYGFGEHPLKYVKEQTKDMQI